MNLMGLLFQCALNFRLLAMPHFLMELVCIGRLMYYTAQLLLAVELVFSSPIMCC